MAQTRMSVPAAFQTPPQMPRPAAMQPRNNGMGPIQRPTPQLGRGQMAMPATSRPAATMVTGGGPAATPTMPGGAPSSAPTAAGVGSQSGSRNSNPPSTEGGQSASASFKQGGSVASFAFGGYTPPAATTDRFAGDGGGQQNTGGNNAGWGNGSDQAFANEMSWNVPRNPGELNGGTFDQNGQYWLNGRQVTGTGGMDEGNAPSTATTGSFTTDVNGQVGGNNYYAAGHAGQFGNITEALEASEGLPSYADGGDVDSGNLAAPTNGQPDFDAAFAKVQQGLQYGRQQSGLLGPRTSGQPQQGFNQQQFQPTQELYGPKPAAAPRPPMNGEPPTGGGPFGGARPAFAGGGGVLPDTSASPSAMPGAAPQPQASPSSNQQQPPSMASYVMGAGAMPPDQAQAMEARIDPQGQMDPSGRKLAAVGAAPDADTAFKLLQAQRQKFNSYRAFAQAALQGTPQKPADLAAATHAATQAYQNVPDGNSATFQPAGNNVAVTVKQLAKRGASKPAQGMANGGLVKGFDEGGDTDPLDEDNNPVTLPINGGNVPLPEARPASAPQGTAPTASQGTGVIPTETDADPTGEAAGASQIAGGAASAVGQTIKKLISAADFGKFISGNGGSYDNTVDTGLHVTIPSLPDASAQPTMPTVAGRSPQEALEDVGAQGAPVPAQGAPPQSGGPTMPTEAGASPAQQLAKFAGPAPQKDRPVQIGIGRDDVPPQIANMARAMFPSVDQTPQRLAFIQNQMNIAQEQASKLDVAKNTHSLSAAATAEGRVEASKNYAGARVTAEQVKAAAAQNIANARNPQEQAKWSVLKNYVTANPDTDPTPFMKQIGLDPNAVSGAQPAAQPAQGSSNQSAIRYDASGKGWMKGPDGKVIPAPET